MPRELFWSGFGFQVWCQLLTHVVRAADASLIIVDEPEIYLHPQLQRQFLAIVRDLATDTLLATHSSDLLQEAESGEIVLVDKHEQNARRVSGIRGVELALESIGSIRNFTLTEVARSRRVLLVAGSDMRLIRQFARVLDLSDLANGTGIASVPLGLSLIHISEPTRPY